MTDILKLEDVMPAMSEDLLDDFFYIISNAAANVGKLSLIFETEEYKRVNEAFGTKKASDILNKLLINTWERGVSVYGH